MVQRFVEVARFNYPADAQILMSILRSEHIECYLRNEISSQVMGGMVDIGGARVEIAEEDVQRALDIMQASGYKIPDENEVVTPIEKQTGWTRFLPCIGKLAFEKQLFILLLIVAIFLGLLVYLGSLLSSN